MIAESATIEFIAWLPAENNAGQSLAVNWQTWRFAGFPGRMLADYFSPVPQGRFGMQTGAKQQRVRGMIDSSKRVVVPPHVLFRLLDGESVLLNLESERYFGLDATGTRMWELVTAEPNITGAFEKLLAEFDVEPEALRGHLNELLSGLVENGLLQVLPVDVGTTQTV
jgi:Coenzyme PQQ synthesis protein D (PqqD)